MTLRKVWVIWNTGLKLCYALGIVFHVSCVCMMLFSTYNVLFDSVLVHECFWVQVCLHEFKSATLPLPLKSYMVHPIVPSPCPKWTSATWHTLDPFPQREGHCQKLHQLSGVCGIKKFRTFYPLTIHSLLSTGRY